MALIILLSLFVGYRGFFGKKDAGSSDVGGGLDAVQLEKTLQRILENQSKSNAATHAESATEHADLDSHDKASAGGNPEMAAEVAQLKATIAENRKKTEALQAKVKEAEEKAAAAIASAGSGAAAPAEATAGMSEQEKEDFAAKIRDLEARLAEYEIISEDIADLSRYREENDELRKELDNVKANAGAAPTAAAPTPAPAAPAPEAPAPVEVAAAPELEVPVAEAAPAEESANSDLIDDELMREFAAAVEGQQNKTLEKVVEKAGDGSTEAQDTGDDATKLMSEFENFVAKKS